MWETGLLGSAMRMFTTRAAEGQQNYQHQSCCKLRARVVDAQTCAVGHTYKYMYICVYYIYVYVCIHIYRYTMYLHMAS